MNLEELKQKIMGDEADSLPTDKDMAIMSKHILNEEKQKCHAITLETIEGNTYKWTGKHYDFLNMAKFEDMANNILQELGIPSPSLVTKHAKSLQNIYSYKGRDFILKMKLYNPLRDTGKIAVSFNNGTLYISKEGKVQFTANEWDITNINFYTLDYNYQEPDIEHKSILEHWLNVRFGENGARFLKMYLADLLLTWNDTEVLLYIYGGGGTGKNTFLGVLEKYIGQSNISTVNLNQFGETFGITQLFQTIVNISNEIQDRNEVNTETFKQVISRDTMSFQSKYKDSKTSRPLAKHIAIANGLPNIKIDSGIERRMLPLETCNTRIDSFNGEQLTDERFQELMTNDSQGFTKIILDGIKDLISFKMSIKTAYKNLVGTDEKLALLKENNSVCRFIDDYFEEGEPTDFLRVKNMAEFFNDHYSGSLEGINVHKVSLERFTKEMKNLIPGENLFKIPNPLKGGLVKKGNYIQGWKLKKDIEIELNNDIDKQRDYWECKTGKEASLVLADIFKTIYS